MTEQHLSVMQQLKAQLIEKIELQQYKTMEGSGKRAHGPKSSLLNLLRRHLVLHCLVRDKNFNIIQAKNDNLSTSSA